MITYKRLFCFVFITISLVCKGQNLPKRHQGVFGIRVVDGCLEYATCVCVCQG